MVHDKGVDFILLRALFFGIQLFYTTSHQCQMLFIIDCIRYEDQLPQAEKRECGLASKALLPNPTNPCVSYLTVTLPLSRKIAFHLLNIMNQYPGKGRLRLEIRRISLFVLRAFFNIVVNEKIHLIFNIQNSNYGRRFHRTRR